MKARDTMLPREGLEGLNRSIALLSGPGWTVGDILQSKTARQLFRTLPMTAICAECGQTLGQHGGRQASCFIRDGYFTL